MLKQSQSRHNPTVNELVFSKQKYHQKLTQTSIINTFQTVVKHKKSEYHYDTRFACVLRLNYSAFFLVQTYAPAAATARTANAASDEA